MKDMMRTGFKLQSDQINRALHSAKDSAQVAMQAPKAQTYAEATDLLTATFDRYTALQRKWTDQWVDWLHYAGTLEGADTVPKVMERTGNIFLQAQAQMVSQAGDLANLTENVGVNYSYWISKQLDDEAK